MAVSGTWTLFFDWGCTGKYYQTGITFNADGTFTTTDGESGKWMQVEGMVSWLFDVGNTVYAGNVVSGAMVGMATTWDGQSGCFYCIQSMPTEARDAAPTKNSAGR